MLSYTPNNGEGHKRLIRKLEYLLQHIDVSRRISCPATCLLDNRIPLAGVAHQNGTIRFGRDPQTSALDVNCKAHEVDNLYVVDGSFFPSSGAVNPALTIMANALRVGDHLLRASRRHDPRRGGGSRMNPHRRRWSVASSLAIAALLTVFALAERGRRKSGRIGPRSSGHAQSIQLA